jgi:predicted RNA-binding protein with PUA domain
MFVLVCLDIELTLMQDRCTVCAESTIGSEIVLDVPDGSPR